LCFSHIGGVFNPDGSPKPICELDDDTAAAIKRYDIQERVVDGVVVARTIRVEFWDKIAALDMAARHLGFYERDNTQRGEAYRIMVELVGDRDAATRSTELHPIFLTKER
jgi:phage terminase small subunit